MFSAREDLWLVAGALLLLLLSAPNDMTLLIESFLLPFLPPLPSIAACDVWCDMSRVEKEVRDLGVQDGRRGCRKGRRG